MRYSEIVDIHMLLTIQLVLVNGIWWRRNQWVQEFRHHANDTLMIGHPVGRRVMQRSVLSGK